MIDGRQRLQNLQTKVNIIARRNLGMFMRGDLQILPCSGDHLDAEIAREFDRLAEGKRDTAGE